MSKVLLETYVVNTPEGPSLLLSVKHLSQPIRSVTDNEGGTWTYVFRGGDYHLWLRNGRGDVTGLSITVTPENGPPSVRSA